MPKHTLEFTGISRISLTHTTETNSATLNHTDILLETSKTVDAKRYHKSGEITTEAGARALANCFLTGLASVIKIAHKQGWRNEVDFQKWCIAELNRHFVTNVEIEHGKEFPSP